MSRRTRSLRASPEAKGGVALAILAVGGLGAYFFAKAKKDAAALQAEAEKAKIAAMAAQADADRAAGLEKFRLQVEADKKKAEAIAKAAEAEAAKEAKRLEEETKRLEAQLKADAEYKLKKDQLDYTNKKKNEAEEAAKKKQKEDEDAKAKAAQAQFEAETAKQVRVIKYTPTPPKGYSDNKTLAEVAREQYGDWRYWSLIADLNALKLKDLGVDLKYRDRGILEAIRVPWLPKGIVLDLPPNGADFQAVLAAGGGQGTVFQKSAKYSWMVIPDAGTKARYQSLFGKDPTLP